MRGQKQQVQPFLVSYKIDSPFLYADLSSLLMSFMERFVKSALLKCQISTEPVQVCL